MTTTKPDIVEVDTIGKGKSDFHGNASFGRLLLRFITIYWRSLVVILWPILLCPILIINNATAYKCLYVVLIMAMYWVTEALPLPITAFIPVFLFPMMGIMSTSDVTTCYLNDTTMMFLASLIIAVAIEHSGLHMRIALLIIKTVGCGHRRLTLGIFLVTMFLSMWISNTAATAMIVPIVQTVLIELENQGLAPMFIEDEDNPEKGDDGEPVKRPTHTTLTYYLITAYASSIGGTGTVVGTGTNLTFKGIFETRFPNSPGINFSDWMCYGVPTMLVCGFMVWLWLQVMYMGMFRPNSKDAKAINIGKEGEKIAEAVIEQKYKELGPLTWHQFCIAVLFVVVIFLWFFRNPGFINGWPEYITDVSVKDSTAAIFVTLLMFILPANLGFVHSFSKDPSKRPSQATPALLNWRIIQTKMHWGFLFLLGGGFAVSSAITSSGLSAVLGDALSAMASFSPLATLCMVCFIIQIVTELTASVAVANIVLPVVAELAVTLRLHPLYLMLPATYCTSFAFHLPVGTPPNAIATAAGHIKTKNFIVAGIGPTLITFVVVIIAFPTWGNFIYGLDDFPSWAES